MNRQERRKDGFSCLILIIILILAIAWFQIAIELPYQRQVNRLAAIEAMYIASRIAPNADPTQRQTIADQIATRSAERRRR